MRKLRYSYINILSLCWWTGASLLAPRAAILDCPEDVLDALNQCMYEVFEFSLLSYNVIRRRRNVEHGAQLVEQYAQSYDSFRQDALVLFKMASTEGLVTYYHLPELQSRYDQLNITCTDIDLRCSRPTNIAYQPSNSDDYAVLCPAAFMDMRFFGPIHSTDDRVSVVFQLFTRVWEGDRIGTSARATRHQYIRPFIFFAKELFLRATIERRLQRFDHLQEPRAS